jgi:hypothetical protein
MVYLDQKWAHELRSVSNNLVERLDDFNVYHEIIDLESSCAPEKMA